MYVGHPNLASVPVHVHELVECLRRASGDFMQYIGGRRAKLGMYREWDCPACPGFCCRSGRSGDCCLALTARYGDSRHIQAETQAGCTECRRKPQAVTIAAGRIRAGALKVPCAVQRQVLAAGASARCWCTSSCVSAVTLDQSANSRGCGQTVDA